MQAAIDVERVSKRFARPLPRLSRLLGRRGPDAIEALRDVSLQVAAGETFGLVGRNGQGKTTLIKTVCGLIEPSAGCVRVFGHDSVRAAREVKRRVGLVSADERSFYFRLTGFENLLFFARLWGLAPRAIGPRIEALAEAFELTPVLARPFQEYSAGNKQRLAIARALLPDPPLLLLDEPTRSLDPISAEGLRCALAGWAGAGAGKTVLITTHNLGEIEALCARVAILSRGRVIECASLASLREKYAHEERIELSLSGVPSQRFLADLHAQLGHVERVPGAGGGFILRFSRRAEDERLQQALALCMREGLTVLGCDTMRSGLRHVLEAVEARVGARERSDVEAGNQARERSDVEAGAGARERSDVEAGAGARERSDVEAGNQARGHSDTEAS